MDRIIDDSHFTPDDIPNDTIIWEALQTVNSENFRSIVQGNYIIKTLLEIAEGAIVTYNKNTITVAYTNPETKQHETRTLTYNQTTQQIETHAHKTQSSETKQYLTKAQTRKQLNIVKEQYATKLTDILTPVNYPLYVDHRNPATIDFLTQLNLCTMRQNKGNLHTTPETLENLEHTWEILQAEAETRGTTTLTLEEQQTLRKAKQLLLLAWTVKTDREAAVAEKHEAGIIFEEISPKTT